MKKPRMKTAAAKRLTRARWHLRYCPRRLALQPCLDCTAAKEVLNERVQELDDLLHKALSKRS